MGALGDRRFRRLLVGSSVSSFGDSALYLSLGIWAKELTGSNAAAGQVFLGMGLGYLAAPLTGRLADRFPRRSVLNVTSAALGLVVLCLLLVHTRSQLWIVYAVALAYGVGGSVSGAARAGLVRDLLGDADLPAANAALQTIGQGLRLVSPAAGASLYAWLGGGSLAVMDTLTFAVAIIALASIRITESPPSVAGDTRVARGLLDGFVHLRRSPLLTQLTLTASIAMVVLGFYESVTFAVIAAVHQPPSLFGVLMSVQAGGSIAGGLLATRLMNRVGEARTLGIALTIWVIATAIYTIPALFAAIVALVIFGAAVPLCAISLATANQRYTPPRLQGRVSAASDMATTLSQTVSIAVGAALVDTIGYEPLLAVAIAVLTIPAAVLLTRPAPLSMVEPSTSRS